MCKARGVKFGSTELTLPQFDPELVQLMRTVLEDAMTRVPLEISGTTTKAYLAEAILEPRPKVKRITMT